jgi:hypothetical protein
LARKSGDERVSAALDGNKTDMNCVQGNENENESLFRTVRSIVSTSILIAMIDKMVVENRVITVLTSVA